MSGRPTKYKPEYNKQVYKLALLGATDKEFADFFDVTEQTINNWKEKEPEFFESIKKGKIKADAKVAKSLYKRALGYKYTEKKTEEVDDETTKITWTDKEVVADVAAINIWLKNRRGRVDPEEGQKWADKHEFVHSGTVKSEIIVPDEETKKHLNDLMNEND
jgi:hypothetical protein